MDVKRFFESIDVAYRVLKDTGVTRDMIIAQRVKMLKSEEQEYLSLWLETEERLNRGQ